MGVSLPIWVLISKKWALTKAKLKWFCVLSLPTFACMHHFPVTDMIMVRNDYTIDGVYLLTERT